MCSCFWHLYQWWLLLVVCFPFEIFLVLGSMNDFQWKHVLFRIMLWNCGSYLDLLFRLAYLFDTARTRKGAAAALLPDGGTSPGSPIDLLLPKGEASCCCWGVVVGSCSPCGLHWNRGGRGLIIVGAGESPDSVSPLLTHQPSGVRAGCLVSAMWLWKPRLLCGLC